jgi:hypothetical protein
VGKLSVGKDSIKDSGTHNLRKRPLPKLKHYAAPDNFELIGSLDESGNLFFGDELRREGLFQLVLEIRKQAVAETSYGNINRLLEFDESGELNESNVLLALAEQVSITNAHFSMHNVRRGANLLKLLREVQMSSKFIASASGRAAPAASHASAASHSS